MTPLDDRRRRLAGVPVRIVRRTDADRGAVLVYHGLGGGIADQTEELHSLARRGFVVLGVDNVGHGERRAADFERRFDSGRAGFDRRFTDAVEETIGEIPDLLDAAVGAGLATPGRIGVCGISMGGFIAYGAPLVDRRIAAVTPILASPRWRDDRPSSPHRQANRYPPVALLAANAGRDANVPAADARAFHAALRPRYVGVPERLEYFEIEEAEHFMSTAQWQRLWAHVVDWLVRFVGSDQPG